jgi:hypothetical protein
MENLLLVLDEIDDLFSTAALLWRPVASFLAAAALFFATGFFFLTMPMVAGFLALGLIGWGLVEHARERRNASSQTLAGSAS